MNKDDNFFKEKYNKLKIESRLDWYNLKIENPDILSKFQDHLNYITKLLKEKGISCISGNLMKATGKTGPTQVINENESTDVPEVYEHKSYNLEDIIEVDYNELFNTECDKDKKFRKRLFEIKFDRYLIDPEKRDKYNNFASLYENDKNNGNLELINECFLKISEYANRKELKKDENYIDGGVICNLGIIISEYIKTGILNTDIDRFKHYSEKNLNEEYNTYIIFLLLSVFTCKYRRFQMLVDGVVERKKWYINLLRRRYSNRHTRTTCVIPRFISDTEGNIMLYNDNNERMDK